MQLKSEIGKRQPEIIKKLEKNESMWDENLQKELIAKCCIASSSTVAPPMHPALYRIGPKQRRLEQDKAIQIKNTGDAKLANMERASRIVILS